MTILPCGPTQPLEAQRTLPLFPLCGLVVGALLLLVDYGASLFWQRNVVAVLDVVALTMVTGALHLDGLADTADGLYGHRSPEKALAIMKDSRIGAMGMVTVACCLAVKWAGLCGLDMHRAILLLLVPAAARGGILFAVRFLPYGRPEGGTGQAFFQGAPRLRDHWAAAAVLLTALLLTGWSGVLLIAAFAAVTAGVLTYYRLKINCITGDMLGALIEITEAGLFLILSAGHGPA
ncbi:MAG: adenosylcobinamide-GDP ribazoletransferase [Desulfatitalea sp.]|nr:adenosylcobinamide-GDP ribazoletransferase [Desulfatitalea sp.]